MQSRGKRRQRVVARRPCRRVVAVDGSAAMKDLMRQHVQGAELRYLRRSGTSARQATPTAKGHAPFWVGAEDEPPQRITVPVRLLAHPRIMELLEEAREEYGHRHVGAVVVLCTAERFQEAVNAARTEERHRRNQHHHFGLSHLVGCFRPSCALS